MSRYTSNIIVVFIICMAIKVNAQEFQQVTTRELTERSKKIIIGTVVDEYSAWDDLGREIYTYIRLKVQSTIKSFNKDSLVLIRQLGGKVGNIESQVPGISQFQVGENVLVFLGPYRGTPYFGLIDWRVGKYAVKDVASKKLLKGNGPGNGLEVAQFVAKVRKYLE